MKVPCKPYFKKRDHLRQFSGASWSVPNLCSAYQWPLNQPGNGIIAIVELGGGWVPRDMQAYFASIGQPVPTIADVSVDGTNNSKQLPPNDADAEVALDIQVSAAAYYAAAGRPANIRVYWAQDIAMAVLKAAQDGCAVCSISWGADEAMWGPTAALAMEQAAASATASGMVVLAAAGDNDSSDGGPNAANVDCPASCPHVVACGGTSKTINSEVVWNNNPGQSNGEGTGGGYSTIFPTQTWQVGAPQPIRGRMVCDVSANADPFTGYEILFYDTPQIIGGTSAVAPLYAGLFAALPTARGFINRKIWKFGHRSCFNDITQGDNGAYSAMPGPDAPSGLGTPVGVNLAAVFAQ